MVHVKKPWPIAVQGTFHITGSVPTNSSAKSLKPLAQAIRSAAHGWVLAAFAETAMPGGCFRLHGVVDLGGSPVAFQDAEMPLNAMPCAVHWFFSSAFGCSDRFPERPCPSLLCQALNHIEPLETHIRQVTESATFMSGSCIPEK